MTSHYSQEINIRDCDKKTDTNNPHKALFLFGTAGDSVRANLIECGF